MWTAEDVAATLRPIEMFERAPWVLSAAARVVNAHAMGRTSRAAALAQLARLRLSEEGRRALLPKAAVS